MAEPRPRTESEKQSTVLSEAEEALVVAFRHHTLIPLADCLYTLVDPQLDWGPNRPSNDINSKAWHSGRKTAQGLARGRASSWLLST